MSNSVLIGMPDSEQPEQPEQPSNNDISLKCLRELFSLFLELTNYFIIALFIIMIIVGFVCSIVFGITLLFNMYIGVMISGVILLVYYLIARIICQ